MKKSCQESVPPNCTVFHLIYSLNYVTIDLPFILFTEQFACLFWEKTCKVICFFFLKILHVFMSSICCFYMNIAWRNIDGILRVLSAEERVWNMTYSQHFRSFAEFRVWNKTWSPNLGSFAEFKIWTFRQFFLVCMQCSCIFFLNSESNMYFWQLYLSLSSAFELFYMFLRWKIAYHCSPYFLST